MMFVRLTLLVRELMRLPEAEPMSLQVLPTIFGEVRTMLVPEQKTILLIPETLLTDNLVLG